jgi:hypothetical protein
MNVYEVRPRNDKRYVDLISDALRLQRTVTRETKSRHAVKREG